MRLIALLGLVAALAGCRTTSPEEGAEPKAAAGQNLSATLTLSKDEDQALYLKMLGVELAAGVQVPKDQLHSAKGVIECHKEGVLETCVLRVRLAEKELSASQPLDAEVSEKVWSFIKASRPEVAAEKLVLSDVACDYIGKKSPPYTVEDVSCQVGLTRAVNEAVFVEPTAEELAEALRGQQSFGNNVMTLTGAVQCRWIEGSPRTPCLVRAIVGGVLQEKVTEVSGKNAGPVARKMLQAALDATKLAGDGKAQELPREVMGALTCVIDSAKVEADGTRKYLCRARL